MAEPTQSIPDPNQDAKRVFIYLTSVLLALAFTTLVGRIVFKVRSNLQFTLEDFLIVLGFLLAVSTWALLFPSSRNIVTPSDIQHVIEIGVVSVLVAICSIACIKISVASLLLRLAQNTTWVIFLRLLIGIILSTSAAFFLFDALQCIPLAATWDFFIKGKCVNITTIRTVSNVSTGINITTDVILALFPLTFLRQMRRPFLEKTLVAVLMAIGMTAAAASITRAIYVQKWVHDPNNIAIGTSISTLTCAEMFIGITAACLPSFKPVLQKLLVKMGIDFSNPRPYSFFRSVHGESGDNQATIVVEDPTLVNSRSVDTANSDTLTSFDLGDLGNPSLWKDQGNGKGKSEDGRRKADDFV